MNRMISTTALALIITAGSAMAQTQTLIDGSQRYEYGNTQTGVNGNANLYPVFTSSFVNDWISHNQFFYRVGTGTSANNNGIRTIGTLGSFAFTQVSANTGRYDYTNLGTALGGLFNASITTTLTNGGTGANGNPALNLLSTIVLTNPSTTATRTINFYNLVSPNVSSFGNDDLITQVAGSGGTRFNAGESSSTNFVDINGFTNNRWQIGVNSTNTGSTNNVPGLFTNVSGSGGSATLNLSNNNTGATASNILGQSVGLQWTIVLAPGQSATLYSAIGINQAAVPAPAAAGLLGLGLAAAGRRRRA